MKNFFLSLSVILSMMMTLSCTKTEKVDVEAIQRENDSLVMLNAQTKAEYEEVLQLINEIQVGFEQIKSAENYLKMNNNGGDDISPSVREQIANDITLISKTLKENKERINQLQKQLNDSKNQSAQLKQTINTLNSMIEEKSTIITELQSELAKRDIKIAELDDAVTTLSEINRTQTQVIDTQESELNKVYYAFGTSKELREQNIIENRGRNLLKGEFNQEYFTQADMRQISTLELGSKKAEILTAHPNGSYTLDKDAGGYLTLKIVNPQLFWSTSKYLVVQVD